MNHRNHVQRADSFRLTIVYAFFALLVAWPSAFIVRAGDQVPYRGRTEGWVTSNEEITTEDGTVTGLVLKTEAIEFSLHGGRGYQYTTLTIQYSASAPPTATGNTDAYTANGDIIYISFVISATETEPLLKFEGSFSITGGTGRFKGATGGGILSGVADLSAGTWDGEFDGVISTPGSLKGRKS